MKHKNQLPKAVPYADAFESVLHVIDENQDRYASVLAALLDGSVAFKHVVGVSNEKLDAMYFLGYQLYSEGKYSQAVDVFGLINLFDPVRAEAWIGAGASLKMLKEYSKAYYKYSVSLLIEPSNLETYYHMAYCLLALNLRKQAIDTLNLLLDVSKDLKTDAYKSWAKKAHRLLELLHA